MAATDYPMSSSPRRHRHDEPIAESIAAVTRGIHARLNKSIIARLPFALPPRSSDPSAYVTGLLHIAPIYITFENLWHNFIEPDFEDGVDPHAELVEPPPQAIDALLPATSPLSTPPPHGQRRRLSVRIHSVLHALHLPGLIRGQRLKSDIQALTGWADHVVDSQLQMACHSEPLAAMVEHMGAAIREKPLLLVTYTYILYMALFAGGRFIRATLESAGDAFWQAPLSPIRPTLQPCVPTPVQRDTDTETHPHNISHICQPAPLSFFHFDTPQDGEDLKAEFKRRLRISEAALEPPEVNDIVHEATKIFEHITAIVNQLDIICEDDASDTDAATTPGDYLQLMPLLSRLRDSVAVTKERNARTSPVNSSSEGESAGESAGTVVRRRKYTSSGSSESRTSGSIASEHPAIPALAGVELCPVMAVGTVRLSSAPVVPQKDKKSTWASRREQLRTADLTSCILATLLGVVAISVILASQRASIT